MHHWQGAGGVRLAGDSWGTPGRPLVVLLHGGGQTRHAWRGTGEKLATAGYQVVAFDARGHGDSDWAPDGQYSQDIQVADLRCVLAASDGQRPILVGASMGGGTSLAAVGEGLDAAALVLVDIAPRIEPEGVERIRAFMSRNPDGFATLEEVADAIAVYQPHRGRQTDLSGLAKNVRLGDDGRYRWHWDPRFLAVTRDLPGREHRLEAFAHALNLPTLLIRGGLSDVLSEEGAQAFRALCPQAEYVNIADAGHMVAGDRNDVFAQAIVSFLARSVPDAGAGPSPRGAPGGGPPPGGDVNDIP